MTKIDEFLNASQQWLDLHAKKLKAAKDAHSEYLKAKATKENKTSLSARKTKAEDCVKSFSEHILLAPELRIFD